MAATFSWRRKWPPTPVSLPGESHGQRSLMGHSPWGRPESDTPEHRQQRAPPPPGSSPCPSGARPGPVRFPIFLTLVSQLAPPASARSPGEEGLGLAHAFTLSGLWRTAGTQWFSVEVRKKRAGWGGFSLTPQRAEFCHPQCHLHEIAGSGFRDGHLCPHSTDEETEVQRERQTSQHPPSLTG